MKRNKGSLDPTIFEQTVILHEETGHKKFVHASYLYTLGANYSLKLVWASVPRLLEECIETTSLCSIKYCVACKIRLNAFIYALPKESLEN